MKEDVEIKKDMIIFYFFAFFFGFLVILSKSNLFVKVFIFIYISFFLIKQSYKLLFRSESLVIKYYFIKHVSYPYSEIEKCFFTTGYKFNGGVKIKFKDGKKINTDFYNVSKRVDVMVLLLQNNVTFSFDKKNKLIQSEYKKAIEIIECAAD